MALKFGGKSKFARGDDEGINLSMAQSLSSMSGSLMGLYIRPVKLWAFARSGTRSEGLRLAADWQQCLLHLLERGQGGHLDILMFFKDFIY